MRWTGGRQVPPEARTVPEAIASLQSHSVTGGGLACWARGLTAWASSCPLPLSASVRLPASTVKLGEKLERYHTAVQVGRALAGAGEPAGARGGPCISPCVPCSQRSESVKSPGSPRTELFVAPVGVASKRHLFEKELVGQSRAEPASSRKVRAQAGGSEVSNPGPVRLCQFGQNPPSTRVSVCVLSPRAGGWPSRPTWPGPGGQRVGSCPGLVAPSPDVSFSPQEHLKLSGVVTSRLNLWISRTQESGEQDSQVRVPPGGLWSWALLWWGEGPVPGDSSGVTWGGGRAAERGLGLGSPSLEGEGPGGQEPCTPQSALAPAPRPRPPTRRRGRRQQPPGGPSGERRRTRPWTPR